MELGKFSLGMGDRFGRQGKAQLAALIKAKEAGVEITPVWNKSYREHQIVGTEPMSVRREADEAVAACGWEHSYFVDADHIGLKTVDLFLESSDFFTLDVADFIGKEAESAQLDDFVKYFRPFAGQFEIPGISQKFDVNQAGLIRIARKYLFAVEEAGRIYRHVLEYKKDRPFLVEVSMDETDKPQTPVELFFILGAVARQGIPARTIAPKFTGRFNKGVDYSGDLARFALEFEQDVAVIRFAVDSFSLPRDLKLSVHSGSDKYSIYTPMRDTLKRWKTGVHLKTAGTTWLEELIGLAEAGGGGLSIAKTIYREAFSRFDDLCKPYQTVIDIDPDRLPDPDEVDQWDGNRFARTLRHVEGDRYYNSHFRQLLHVGYKVAAEMGKRYTEALKKNEKVIAKQVTANLYERHILPLFLEG